MPQAQSDPFAAYVVKSVPGAAMSASSDDPFAAYEVKAGPASLYDPNRKPVSAEDFVTKKQAPIAEPGSFQDFFGQGLAATVPFGHELGPQSLGNLAMNVGEVMNPVTLAKGVYGAVTHPVDTVRGIVRAQVDEGRKAIDLAKQGRRTEALGHGIAAALPLLGPAAAAAGEQGAEGDISGMVGKGIGLVAPFGVTSAVPKAVEVPALMKADSAAADALALAERENIPISAATATGNPYVKSLQHMVDRSLAGSIVAGRAGRAEATGLATLGEQLAAKARPMAVTASEAGEAAQKGISGVVSTQRGIANDAYGRLREMEAASLRDLPPDTAPVPLPPDRTGHFTLPEPTAKLNDAQLDAYIKAHGGTGPAVPAADWRAAKLDTAIPGKPVVPMVVDLSPVKAALKPIAERLAAKKAVTGALIGAEGNSAAAIESLLSGPDHVPLSVADSALSDLKRMARTNHPDLRNVGQGIAAKAVGDLHQAVSATAKAAGPDAVAALEEGRTATKAKYAAGKLLENLAGKTGDKSPVTAFRSMTQGEDTGVGRLQATLKQSPEAKPYIARAVLDKLVNNETVGPAKAWSSWQKLGPETKAALYAPEHVKDLDSFFRLRKMMAENVNPSGSAHTAVNYAKGAFTYANPLLGAVMHISDGVVAGLLHTRAGVRLLTRGMRLPIGNSAASAAWASDFAAATSGATSPSESRTPLPAGALAR